MNRQQRRHPGPNDIRGNGHGGIGFNQPPRQQIDINQLPQIECNCGNATFVMGMGLRYANRLVSANGQPTVVQVPLGWVCTNCGAPNDFAYREELSDIIKPPVNSELELVPGNEGE